MGGSSDKPDMNFGIPLMDDASLQSVLAAVTPTLQRNFIVPKLVGNLIAAERKETLARFPSEDFTKTAIVIMGEPSGEYKEKVHSKILDEKVSRLAAEKAKKDQDLARKRLLDEKRKKAVEAKKLREEAQK